MTLCNMHVFYFHRVVGKVWRWLASLAMTCLPDSDMQVTMQPRLEGWNLHVPRHAIGGSRRVISVKNKLQVEEACSVKCSILAMIQSTG